MQDETPANNESSSPKKYWLRIIIVLAIGIPVLLELNTLYNLVLVHVWGKEEPKQTEVIRSTDQGAEVTIGDTLFAGRSYLVTVQDMRVNVSPNRWEFNLTLAAGSEPGREYRIKIDSLILNSGERLSGWEPSEWRAVQEAGHWETTGDWEISNGDIPDILYMAIHKAVTPDSVIQRHKKFNLGSVPVRYRE